MMDILEMPPKKMEGRIEDFYEMYGIR